LGQLVETMFRKKLFSLLLPFLSKKKKRRSITPLWRQSAFTLWKLNIFLMTAFKPPWSHIVHRSPIIQRLFQDKLFIMHPKKVSHLPPTFFQHLHRDQIWYWAIKIIIGVPETIHVIVSLLVELLLGSGSVGQSI